MFWHSFPVSFQMRSPTVFPSSSVSSPQTDENRVDWKKFCLTVFCTFEWRGRRKNSHFKRANLEVCVKVLSPSQRNSLVNWIRRHEGRILAICRVISVFMLGYSFLRVLFANQVFSERGHQCCNDLLVDDPLSVVTIIEFDEWLTASKTYITFSNCFSAWLDQRRFDGFDRQEPIPYAAL
jgi:hypothetical protein